MFSRLEDKIRVESSSLISKKKDSINSWKQRAVWNILYTQSSNDKLHFLSRLALLTEKGQRNYELVTKYYKERNSIAHGGHFINAISMPTVILDFKRLFKEMKA